MTNMTNGLAKGDDALVASNLINAPTGDTTPEHITRLLTPIKLHKVACRESLP